VRYQLNFPSGSPSTAAITLPTLFEVLAVHAISALKRFVNVLNPASPNVEKQWLLNEVDKDSVVGMLNRVLYILNILKSKKSFMKH